MLTFEPIAHRYQFGGVTVPSVTQVLRSLYDFSMVTQEVLERKRQIGVATHAAIALDIANDLDESSVAPEVAGYLKGWRAFRADCSLHEADFGEIERPLYHPTYRFAGTPDMALCLDKCWSVLDVKTAADLHPAVALQLAAYLELLNANTPAGEHKLKRRYALRLRENGTYRLDEMKDKNDLNTFLAFLMTNRWREANLKGA